MSHQGRPLRPLVSCGVRDGFLGIITDHPKSTAKTWKVLGMCLGLTIQKYHKTPKNHEWAALFMPMARRIRIKHRIYASTNIHFEKRLSKHLLLGGTFRWALFCRFRWSVIPFLRTTHRGLDSGPRGPETQVTAKKKETYTRAWNCWWSRLGSVYQRPILNFIARVFECFICKFAAGRHDIPPYIIYTVEKSNAVYFAEKTIFGHPTLENPWYGFK